MHVQVHVYCLSRGIESIRRAVARRVCPAVSNVESIISRVKSTHRILALATSPQITLPATLSHRLGQPLKRRVVAVARRSSALC